MGWGLKDLVWLVCDTLYYLNVLVVAFLICMVCFYIPPSTNHHKTWNTTISNLPLSVKYFTEA